MSEQKKSQDEPPIKLNTQNMRPALRKGSENDSLLAVTSTNSLRPPELNRPIVIPTPAKRTYTSTLLLNEPTKDIPSGCFLFMSWMVLQLNIVDSTELIRVSPTEGKLLHIGRNPESAPKIVDIDLTSYVNDHDGVSRLHAAIKLVGTRLELQDMNSTNGTSINGFRFNPNESHPLRSDDLIMLGKFQLVVKFTLRLESTNKHDTNILSPIE